MGMGGADKVWRALAAAGVIVGPVNVLPMLPLERTSVVQP